MSGCASAVSHLQIDVPGGLLAVYRDRTKDEIRDIAITRFDGKQWSAPKIVSDDHGQISACTDPGPCNFGCRRYDCRRMVHCGR
jgi:hypothetical protein